MKNNYLVLIVVLIVTVALAVGGYYVFRLASNVGKKTSTDEEKKDQDKDKDKDTKDSEGGGESGGQKSKLSQRAITYLPSPPQKRAVQGLKRIIL